MGYTAVPPFNIILLIIIVCLQKPVFLPIYFSSDELGQLR
jgi:hypothetical protein